MVKVSNRPASVSTKMSSNSSVSGLSSKKSICKGSSKKKSATAFTKKINLHRN